jgi:hypothetical protein
LNTKGTRGFKLVFRDWNDHDYDLTVTMIQMPHTQGGCSMTSYRIAQISTRVTMVSRFLGLMGSLPPDKQHLWFPNQVGQHDPGTWTLTHRLQVKSEYVIHVDKYACIVLETYTVQDPPAAPSDNLLLLSPKCLLTDTVRVQELPQPGDSRPVLSPSVRTLSRQIMRN